MCLLLDKFTWKDFWQKEVGEGNVRERKTFFTFWKRKKGRRGEETSCAVCDATTSVPLSSLSFLSHACSFLGFQENLIILIIIKIFMRERGSLLDFLLSLFHSYSSLSHSFRFFSCFSTDSIFYLNFPSHRAINYYKFIY